MLNQMTQKNESPTLLFIAYSLLLSGWNSHVIKAQGPVVFLKKMALRNILIPELFWTLNKQKKNMALNVFGEKLITCSSNPMTGFFRDGCCQTDQNDHGTHTVCAVMTTEFLAFSKSMGNDLSTPRPEYQFPGLRAGDRWCLCASRWVEAHKAHVAPLLILEATHEKTLQYADFETLISYALKKTDE